MHKRVQKRTGNMPRTKKVARQSSKECAGKQLASKESATKPTFKEEEGWTFKVKATSRQMDKARKMV